MLTSEYVKDMGKKFGADLVGIASMARFEGAPEQTDLHLYLRWNTPTAP